MALEFSFLLFTLAVMSMSQLLNAAEQGMLEYDPDDQPDSNFSVPNEVVQINLNVAENLIKVPDRFFGLNVHPGTATYEFAKIELLKRLKPDTVRIMTNIRVDWPLGGAGRVVSTLSDGPNHFNWQPLDLLVRSIVAIGAEPYFALGFGPPNWISGASTVLGRSPPPSSKLGDYADFMATVVHRYAVEKQWPIRRVTVENEPENVGYSIEEYAQLFRLTKELINTKAPGVEVGGPAIGYANWPQSGSHSLSFFASASYFHTDRTPLDFFDWHIYSTSPLVVMRTVQAVQKVFGSSVPLVISELNRDWRYSGQHQDRSRQNNTSWRSVAWLAYLYDNLQTARVDQVFYFAWREATLGLIDARSTSLRPNFYLFSAMTNLIGRQRIVARTSHPSIGVIATNDKGKLSALIYNMAASDTRVTINNASLKPRFFFSKQIFDANQSSDVDLISRQAKAGVPHGAVDSSQRLIVPAGGFLVVSN